MQVSRRTKIVSYKCRMKLTLRFTRNRNQFNKNYMIGLFYVTRYNVLPVDIINPWTIKYKKTRNFDKKYLPSEAAALVKELGGRFGDGCWGDRREVWSECVEDEGSNWGITSTEAVPEWWGRRVLGMSEHDGREIGRSLCGCWDNGGGSHCGCRIDGGSFPPLHRDFGLICRKLASTGLLRWSNPPCWAWESIWNWSRDSGVCDLLSRDSGMCLTEVSSSSSSVGGGDAGGLYGSVAQVATCEGNGFVRI